METGTASTLCKVVPDVVGSRVGVALRMFTRLAAASPQFLHTWRRA